MSEWSSEDGSDESSGQTPEVSATSGAIDPFVVDREPPKDDGEVEQIASLVIARIENKLEQHLHTQMEMPPADQAAELRDRAPEVYRAWIDIARQKAATDAYVQRAQYEVPERLARSGRPWALGALGIILIFCGYIASLSNAGIYVAGIIAALDVVAMLGLFFGFRPARLPESGEKPGEIPPPASDDASLHLVVASQSPSDT